MYRVLGPLVLVSLAASAFAAETHAPTWPLWDGHESIEQYAKRVNLPPTMTLDLGGGVTMALVLIPAGKFVRGAPEPKPVDEDGFRTKIVVGQAVCAVGAGVLLVLIGAVILRAVRRRQRSQYLLAQFIVMIVAAGVAVLGGRHWRSSTRALALAQTEYNVAMGRYRDTEEWEKLAHEVTLASPFYMGKYEVTQEQYQQVMGTNPSQFRGPSLPVEMVSWDDAKEFCKRATAVPHSAGLRNQQSGKVLYRFPTEAEWEFACRAGTTTAYHSGDTTPALDRAAWYGAISGGTTHSVGQKEPNAWGVYDMHGNVWEWCQEGYEAYKPVAAVKPQSPLQGEGHVLRGGSWILPPRYCRSTNHLASPPVDRDCSIGFRVVVERQR